MASFVPTSRFSRVDLPALGRPMRETNPDFIRARSHRPGLHLGVFRFLDGKVLPADPDLVDPPPFGIEHFDAQIVDVETLADGRQPPEVRQQEPADRFETFALDLDVEPLRDLVDVDLAAEDVAAVAFVDDRLRLLVVLVADFADDLFEQIFDGHEPGGAAVFVDDNRTLRLVALKLL